jgi:hypothetical protein
MMVSFPIDWRGTRMTTLTKDRIFVLMPLAFLVTPESLRWVVTSVGHYSLFAVGCKSLYRTGAAKFGI